MPTNLQNSFFSNETSANVDLTVEYSQQQRAMGNDTDGNINSLNGNQGNRANSSSQQTYGGYNQGDRSNEVFDTTAPELKYFVWVNSDDVELDKNGIWKSKNESGKAIVNALNENYRDSKYKIIAASSLADAVNQTISELGPNEKIGEISVEDHGSSGAQKLFGDGFYVQKFLENSDDFEKLGTKMGKNSLLTLHGCRVASGTDGNLLLLQLYSILGRNTVIRASVHFQDLDKGLEYTYKYVVDNKIYVFKNSPENLFDPYTLRAYYRLFQGNDIELAVAEIGEGLKHLDEAKLSHPLKYGKLIDEIVQDIRSDLKSNILNNLITKDTPDFFSFQKNYIYKIQNSLPRTIRAINNTFDIETKLSGKALDISILIINAIRNLEKLSYLHEAKKHFDPNRDSYTNSERFP